MKGAAKLLATSNSLSSQWVLGSSGSEWVANVPTPQRPTPATSFANVVSGSTRGSSPTSTAPRGSGSSSHSHSSLSSSVALPRNSAMTERYDNDAYLAMLYAEQERFQNGGRGPAGDDFSTYDEYDDDDELENYYMSSAAGPARIVFSNRRNGASGFMRSGRQYGRPSASHASSATGGGCKSTNNSRGVAGKGIHSKEALLGSSPPKGLAPSTLGSSPPSFFHRDSSASKSNAAKTSVAKTLDFSEGKEQLGKERIGSARGGASAPVDLDPNPNPNPNPNPPSYDPRKGEEDHDKAVSEMDGGARTAPAGIRPGTGQDRNGDVGHVSSDREEEGADEAILKHPQTGRERTQEGVMDERDEEEKEGGGKVATDLKNPDSEIDTLASTLHKSLGLEVASDQHRPEKSGFPNDSIPQSRVLHIAPPLEEAALLDDLAINGSDILDLKPLAPTHGRQPPSPRATRKGNRRKESRAKNRERAQLTLGDD
eukprot:CAMPEP_0175059514 /NCGR_PEP_ID=MMETSP0052_2-20121109/12476_1 /TAXON_ID=51329 ORGANISM="Polytomella parva, Strain SAG 63-3" /NCGR_SAMPLE_ID=MMETSP0052_2 /ASSEMBLY_ACC=CAM_ASM_000194 /LENGTH=483 /DNA_ID=CAMNT_0016325075 /DNA_START=587 /DNA_END=2038 /DNA_ORIENTATION=+